LSTREETKCGGRVSQHTLRRNAEERWCSIGGAGEEEEEESGGRGDQATTWGCHLPLDAELRPPAVRELLGPDHREYRPRGQSANSTDQSLEAGFCSKC
jgi:hypothetical protein